MEEGAIMPIITDWERNPKTGTWVPIYGELQGYPDSVEIHLNPDPEPVVGDSEIQKQVIRVLLEKEFIIQGSVGTTFANPHLIAGRPIRINNVGVNFSGLYEVSSVKHVINRNNGYEQSIEVRRNAIGEGIKPAPKPAENPALPRPTTPAVEPQTPEPRYYTVQKGDTLWAIAKRYYGNGAEYPKIVSANPIIKDPNLIYPGQKFLIP